MTTILIRSPLQQLGMNRAQSNNGRRRTTRHLFDDDDNEPPAKRVKSDANAKSASQNQASTTDRIVNGKANGTATRTTRSKKSYEEEDNGFAFSRAKSRRQKTTTPVDTEPVAAQAVHPSERVAQDDESSKQATKKRPRKTLPVTPEKDDDSSAPKRRRSKRLSGEANNTSAEPEDPFVKTKDVRKDNNGTGPAAQQTPEPAPATEDVEQPRQAEGSQTTTRKNPVDKQRRVTKIDLLLAETPVIRRNKEMRKTTSDPYRRSSSGIRGKRASSLIDAGSSNVVPHAQVEVADFYRHISQDLTEPRRMRQLLVWCGNRALPSKPTGNMAAEESQARHAARAIIDELLGEFANRNDLSNWFDRPDEPSASLIKKPNPRNVQNATKLQEMEAELLRLKTEKRAWDDLLASTSAQSEESASKDINLEPANINAELLDPSQAEILQTLLGAHDTTNTETSNEQPAPTGDILSITQTRLNNISKSIEFKIDQFADSLHRLEQFRQGAERIADRILAASADRLETLEQDRKKKSGGQLDSIDVLRALSRATKEK